MQDRVVPRPDTELRKRPQQARSRALVDALVEATARVLEREGVAAVTTARVAEVAGVSIGSLYQYFPGGEALIAAVIERQLASDVQALRPRVEALRGASLEVVIEGIVELVVLFYRQQTDLYREMVAAMAAVDREAHVRRVTDGLEQVMHELLEPHVATLAPDLSASVFTARVSLLAAVRAAAAHRPELFDDRRLDATLRRLVAGVLGAGGDEGLDSRR